ncbi:DUF6223 family protein [Micromonospora sp. NPDC047793]|uniref:DUF6223 family protein n=1 Tax=Micromonospora sp. NPDC047793 TaxID=3154342 RepID=UPI0033F9C040
MIVTDLLATSAVDAYTPTGGRVVATLAALLALGGAITGVLATPRRGGRWRPILALAAGAPALVVGALVVATADGGPGTGNGMVGGYAAVVLGLTATVLGGLAMVRSRRTD